MSPRQVWEVWRWPSFWTVILIAGILRKDSVAIGICIIALAWILIRERPDD